METRRDERISQLIQALKRSDKLHLKEAASLLGVSEMTIRRDLNGHSGPVVLLGGYIVLEPRSATHYLLSDQKTRLVEEKRRAARHAAALLEAHQMAFFDCGTTTPWIIDAIDDALPFTGVCYSLNTFLALQEKPQCRAVLCGGEFHASNAIFMPLSLEDTLSHLSPDIAFYSAAGIDCEQGATCYNLEELPVKHWAMRHARYHVLVVDHSKFGKVRPARVGALAKFDVIASDICPRSWHQENQLPNQPWSFISTKSIIRLKKPPSFTDSMTISGRCSMVLSFSLKSIVPTTCPFSSGAVSCG